MSVRLISFFVILPLLGSAHAADFNAEQYHQQNCTRCHDSSVYTREPRMVNSLPALTTQVRRCDSMLETQLFDDDLQALVKHLNQRYYRF